ncbi:MAG: type I methionyl aminopeptidase [Clostridia bacterium]|nr:type I methionyl aminopeptidase [Clostridia bacterium]
MIILKTNNQIKIMREACQIVKETLDLMEKSVRVGITTKELDKLAEDFIRSKGALPSFKGYGGFPATICASPNEQVVHGIPNNVPLKEGDIISIDVGAEKHGYHGDAARTFAVGKIDKSLQDLIDHTKQSFYEGIKGLKVGDHLGDISYRIQKYVEDRGYSVVRELVGHGVGKSLHEDPQVPNYGIKNTGFIIKSGLVIAIEPMINLGKKEVVFESDGWTCRTKDRKASAHYENMIAITDEGIEILTI